MYLLSFAAWRHRFRGFWKDAQSHPFPIWLVKRSGGGGKHSETQAALRSTGVLCTWHNAPSPQETQLLQSTAVWVLNNSNIHVHVKLIPALCTGFPCSNSRSQSLVPCCSVAWPGNCKWHSLGCWVELTVLFLRHWGAFYHKGKQSPSAWEGLEFLLAPAGEQVCRKDKKMSGNYRKL